MHVVTYLNGADKMVVSKDKQNKHLEKMKRLSVALKKNLLRRKEQQKKEEVRKNVQK